MNTLHSIVLGGGCFWCTDAVFRRVRGVVGVECGYSNGHVQHPNYQQVCSGETGHNEVVRVQYDAAQISTRQLLEIFFATHDPTTLNRQGNDVGTQYRSAIYFENPQQAQDARILLDEFRQSGVFGAPIVTELMPLANYWPAEDYHQDYYAHHPQQGYCAFVIAPKLEKLRSRCAALLVAADGADRSGLP